MSIIYSLIARNNRIILSEFTEYHGNFQQISRLLLPKLEKENNKLTIEYSNYEFHYYKDPETDVNILCLTEKNTFEYTYAFGFISDCKKYFYDNYYISKIKRASSYQMYEFEETLKDLTKYYNSKPNITKLGNELSSLNLARNVEIKKADEFFNNEKYELSVTKSNIKNYQNHNISDKIKTQENLVKIKYLLVIVIGVIIILFLLTKLLN